MKRKPSGQHRGEPILRPRLAPAASPLLCTSPDCEVAASSCLVTTAPTFVEPETIRLPKPGLLCPHSGLTRSFLNGLILPCAANNWKPPVRSFPLRKRGAQRGIRLIVWSSLKSYLYAQEADPTASK